MRRLAVTFAEMEKQNEYLSRDQSGSNDGGRRPIGSLLEIIKEDLNNYGECMIPVGKFPLPGLESPPTAPLALLTPSVHRRRQHHQHEIVPTP